MTNVERIESAKRSLTIAEKCLDKVLNNTNLDAVSKHMLVLQGLNLVRSANAALQTAERSLAGQPEPRTE